MAACVCVHVAVRQPGRSSVVGPCGSALHRWFTPSLPPHTLLCAGVYTVTPAGGAKVTTRFSTVFVKRNGKW